MKSFTFLILIGLLPKFVDGQIVYFENFGTGCTTGTLAPAFGWTVTNTGVNQASSNVWYVSADEQGVGAGNCGIGCGGADSRTLHVSADAAAGGDLGAAYFESSAFICSFLGLCSITNKRVESPTINCTGISSIPLSFDYIENGEGTADDCTVFYSANNGTTWTLLDNPPKTAFCGIQGLWATRNLVLPASANNNPTVKIGFRWVNNGNGVGTDPSFAVDNIQVGTPIVLDVEMVDMNVQCDEGVRAVTWITHNEHNADYFNLYRSLNTSDWTHVEKVMAINQTGVHPYQVIDKLCANHSTLYYYIEEVNLDGQINSFEVLSSEQCREKVEVKIFPNPSNGDVITILSSKTNVDFVQIYSIEGRMIGEYRNGDQSRVLSISPELTQGKYLVRVQSGAEADTLSLVIH